MVSITDFTWAFRRVMGRCKQVSMMIWKLLRLRKEALLEIVWMNFQHIAVEKPLAQGFAEFSGVGKPGMNWRCEERGGLWMCTAAPGFGRGDRFGPERQPSMEGSQRGEDRQIAPGGARSLRFGRDDREKG